MSSKAKSAEDWIPFLLTCMDYTPANPDWNKIAEETGSYKAGKYVRQAYNSIRKKHNPLPLVNGSAGIPQTPKSNKKRLATEALDEDDEQEEEEKPKRVRKTKAQPKKTVKKASVYTKLDSTNIEGSDGELNEDLNEDATVDEKSPDQD